MHRPRAFGLRLHAFALALLLAACAGVSPSGPAPAQSTISATAPALPTATATATPPPPPTATPEPAPADYYAGWAVVAYPEQSQADMEAMLSRLKGAGANVVWIGHNNPGEVSAGKPEPGLSYAVYAAAVDPASPDRETALAMIDAQHRMLRAARAVGLPAIFPIGYQIHMGRAWQEAHPKLMRHDTAGQWLNVFNGGVSASPYAPEYRADIRAYYEWARTEFVEPHRDVILMLNLADEPLGGDYSAPAEAEFAARTGFTFADAPPAALGAFQDRVIVDYATWSARQWLELAPDLPVTVSFCGAQGRWSYRMPDVEALFRDTPPNFVPTFDAYMHDYLPWEPLTEAEVGSLALFVRTLGHYSARWGREMWLWSAGNRWGLAGFSPGPGGVSDALANGYLLALAARSTGGHLRGLAVWSYNVRDQGLYGDADPAPYSREAMFTHVSAAFEEWRRIMVGPAGQAEVLVYLSDTLAHTHLGMTRNAVLDSAVNFDHLLPLARLDVPAAVVGRLPPLPDGRVHTILVLDPGPDTIPSQDREGLRRFLEAGGRVMATDAVLDSIWLGPAADPGARTRPPQVVILRADPLTLSEARWAEVLPASDGLLVSSGDRALLYSLREAAVHLPGGRRWRAFDPAGALRADAVELGRHEFALSP